MVIWDLRYYGLELVKDLVIMVICNFFFGFWVVFGLYNVEVNYGDWEVQQKLEFKVDFRWIDVLKVDYEVQLVLVYEV